jgi:hypothetical protein
MASPVLEREAKRLREQGPVNLAWRAKKAGWIWDEGGPHWFRPHGLDRADYAKTAKEACEY